MDLSVYVKCGPAERAPRTTSLTFPAILSDPLVRMMMKADRIDPAALEQDLWGVAASLPSGPAARDATCCAPQTC
jgi:hypothetical protein